MDALRNGRASTWNPLVKRFHMKRLQMNALPDETLPDETLLEETLLIIIRRSLFAFPELYHRQRVTIY